METDEIAREDPQEVEKILELSRMNGLYEYLSRSIAPSIFGMDDVKKGVLLQMFGGTHKFTANKPGSPKIRGDINVLLVGDPGVSKSQLLRYIHNLAPRGVYTSGKGSSAVGLTAYITRDPDTRQLVLERYCIQFISFKVVLWFFLMAVFAVLTSLIKCRIILVLFYMKSWNSRPFPSPKLVSLPL